MTRVFILMLLCLFTATNIRAQKKINRVNVEDRVMKAVLELPEVKKLAKDNEKKTGPIMAVIKQRPRPRTPYYWVGVGFDQPEMFTTYLHFYVEPKRLKISYFDVINNKVLSLEQWRATEQYRRTNYNPH